MVFLHQFQFLIQAVHLDSDQAAAPEDRAAAVTEVCLHGAILVHVLHSIKAAHSVAAALGGLAVQEQVAPALYALFGDQVTLLYTGSYNSSV